ncbi:MAG: cytochrome P450 [Gemmatimonadetes bacterium]|nr:cytochrome P450 [Gemmatimonadota bacterium]
MRTVIEVTVLVALAWPAFRFLSLGPIRTFYRGMAILVAIMLALYLLVILLAAAFLPAVLSVLAPVALAGLLLERWRARPSYGRDAGLPPGSLGLFPRGPWVSHEFYLEQAAKHGPVFKMSFLHKPMICILGARLGGEFIRAHSDQLVKPGVRLNQFIPRGFLRYMKPADHQTYRRIFQSALTTETLRENETALREIIREALGRMAEESAATQGEGLQPREPLRRMLASVFAWLMLGMRTDDPAFPGLIALLDSLDLRAASFVPGHEDRRALAEIERIIQERGAGIRERLARGESPAPSILARLIRDNEAACEDETILGNLVYMFLIGRVDLTGLFSWTLKLLADNPEWMTRLESATGGGENAKAHDLAARIVRETLRMEQSEYINRRAIADIRHQDFLVPKGWVIRVLVREGHRDPALFPEPDRFNPDRYLAEHQDPQLFGVDVHSCIGVSFTDLVTRAVLTEMALGFRWERVSDGPLQFIPPHWQPGTDFRIRIAPRDAR